MKINDILVEFAPSGGGGSGNYFQELASAWYNGTFDSGSLQKGIKSQQDVERLLQRGIVGPDGVTRKYAIDYNSDFDGVVISSDDYYEHSDYNEQGQEVDSRTGQKWGPYDYMEFGDEQLDESAQWRDPKYKDQLYTQEPPDYNDTREYDRAMWDPKPDDYPGRKELPGGSEYDRTDPLVRGAGIGRSGIKHNILDRGKRKGLPSRDQITSLKQSIRDVHGRHTRANLPEQGMAEAEKNPHTSALGKALYRDLSKEKKASPQQVQRNKERWAQRQAEKQQGVSGGLMNKIANKVMGVAPEQPKYKVGQRVKYETSPHQPDWKDGGRGVGVITAYKNGHYMINGNPVNHFEIKGVVEQGVAESYPKHQDLSGVSTDKLKAYLAKQGQQQTSGEGNQIKRVRAELQSRSQGVAEGFFDRFRKKQQNYGGIDVSVEKEDNNILVKATANGRELGRVLFTPSEQDDNLLVPLDLEVDKRYRGQGIGATMYDYVKSLGYTIRRSQYQTDAGAKFWDKHKSGKNVWEQGVAEGSREQVDPSTVWEVSFDYGPHQSDKVKVRASSQEEAEQKGMRAAKKLGHRFPQLNWAMPVEQGVAESKPKEKEADYGDDYQAMVGRVKKLAGLGPLKTVYDPNKRVYRNMPTAVQPPKK